MERHHTNTRPFITTSPLGAKVEPTGLESGRFESVPFDNRILLLGTTHSLVFFLKNCQCN